MGEVYLATFGKDVLPENLNTSSRAQNHAPREKKKRTTYSTLQRNFILFAYLPHFHGAFQRTAERHRGGRWWRSFARRPRIELGVLYLGSNICCHVLAPRHEGHEVCLLSAETKKEILSEHESHCCANKLLKRQTRAGKFIRLVRSAHAQYETFTTKK